MNKKLMVGIIMVAVLCGSLMFYLNEKPEKIASALARPQEEKSQARAAVFPAPEQTQYAMKLYLDVPQRTIYGVSEITTVNTSDKDLEELWFTIYPNEFKDAKTTPAPASAYVGGFNEGWLQVDTLIVNGEKMSFTQQGGSLHVPVEPLLKNSELRIEMQWRAKVPKVKYRYGCQDTVFMLGNFYPTLNVLTNAGWHNSYNSQYGDPFCFNTADYLVEVNTPENYRIASTGQTIASGFQDDGRTLYTVQAESVRDFCLLVMYDYREVKERINGIDIKCYFPGNKDEVAEQIIRQAGQILRYYSNTFGSYPFQEFTIAFVPMMGFHGMEYSGMIFLQQDLFVPTQDVANKLEQRTFVLAHEIAHQWWYGLVGNDQLREPWLDEGLANWSAHQYMLEVEGRNLGSSNSSKKVSQLNRALADMNSRQDYYATAYSAGEAFWTALEEELGHDTVIQVLRRYLAEYRNQIATTQDLTKVIELEAKKDMDDYLSRWFLEK